MSVRIQISGVLQDWDIYDNRYDIARVDIEVPESIVRETPIEDLYEIEECGVCGIADNSTAEGRLVLRCLECGLISTNQSFWEAEDPCELNVRISPRT